MPPGAFRYQGGLLLRLGHDDLGLAGCLQHETVLDRSSVALTLPPHYILVGRGGG
jgi:hypothetical protein